MKRVQDYSIAIKGHATTTSLAYKKTYFKKEQITES